MKKTIILIAAFISFSFINVFSQTSIFGGYGMQGASLRLNFDLNKEFAPNFNAFIYGEAGFDGYKFSESNFSLSGTNYPSNTRLTYAGFGLSGKLGSNSIFLSPYVGIRYIYARFADQALFDAIGEDKLIRYHNGQKVGPTVENAYGNAVTFDVGTRVGLNITERLALVVSGGISPVKFSTTKTLFGKYWGESPYNNSYYIELPIYRVEAGLNYNF